MKTSELAYLLFAAFVVAACGIEPDATTGFPKTYQSQTEDDALFKLFSACPSPQQTQSERMAAFDARLYQGIWYEWAFHDVAQLPCFACTRMKWTLDSPSSGDLAGQSFSDMYTTNFPGASGSLFAIPLRGTLDAEGRPGVFVESGVATWVIDYGQNAEDGHYEWAVFFKCLDALGSIVFTEVAFVGRTPDVEPELLEELYSRTRELGLDAYGGTDSRMHTVSHADCTYPTDDQAWDAFPARIFGRPELD